MAEDTAKKLPAHLRDDLKFKPGQSGNPAGRPKGARSKLSEDFFKALADDFAKHGTATIQKMRDEKPADYAKMVAGLQSKEVSGEDGAPLFPSDIAWRRVNADD